MKNSNDIIGNRTRDLPTCSAVPQPTAPPRTPAVTHIKVTLNLTLQQTVCAIKKSNIHTFFQKLAGLSSFFDTLCALMPLKNLWEKLPTLATARWNFNLKLIKSAREKKSRLAIFFQNIDESCEDFDSFYMLQEQGFQACYIFKTFSFLTDF